MILCGSFLSSFRWFEKKFVFPHYFLSLIPITQGLRKYALLDFDSLTSAKRFIHKRVGKRYGEYLLYISEFEENAFGGSIISDSGMIRAEITAGRQQQVSQSLVVPSAAILDEMWPSTRYSTEDVEIRRLLWGAIVALRRDSVGALECALRGLPYQCIRGFRFLRGYFEFAYTVPAGGGPHRLVFFDAKVSSVSAETDYANAP
jgi:hypothetical protein